ncbi:MAG: DNA-3-methyladenine glycosylase [Betaproteobacteria bacterium]
MKPDYWDTAAKVLARRDPVLRRLLRQFPEISLVRRSDAFTTLARAITGQQISVRAAQTVWNRIVAATQGRATRLSARAIIALDPVALRGCGLSQRKVEYIRDLATRFIDGHVRPRRWRTMDDEAIIAELVEVKGIGRWTAEMFLMFNLLRPDVLPVDDIGLQRAVENLYNGGRRLPLAELRRIGEAWAPWRSVATWYLWRSLEPVPVQY